MSEREVGGQGELFPLDAIELSATVDSIAPIEEIQETEALRPLDAIAIEPLGPMPVQISDGLLEEMPGEGWHSPGIEGALAAAHANKAAVVEPIVSEASVSRGAGIWETGQYAPVGLSEGARRRMWPSLRTPNFADFGLFGAALILGFLVTTAAVGVCLYYHALGMKSFDDIQHSTWIAVGTQALVYAIGLGVAVPVFRAMWGRGFFSGIHWNGERAGRLRYWLVGTAVVCNLIAMAGNAVLPFPQHAPIDKMFSTMRDAWLLMGFGITVAPFFEEMIFRGFLMPALATGWDWIAGRRVGGAGAVVDAEGNPVWSKAAMVFAALAASLPFAFMHSAQVGAAWGPLLLLYSVSLILCAVRLVTGSLAASTLVHSVYNLLLFLLMLWQTDGFRHLEKM